MLRNMYCDFMGYSLDGKGYIDIRYHQTLLPQYVHLDFPQNVNAYLANLVSLGVLFDMAGTYRIDETVYNEIKRVYGFELLKEQLVPKSYKKIEAEKSYYQITDFGKLFIQACIK